MSVESDVVQIIKKKYPVMVSGRDGRRKLNEIVDSLKLELKTIYPEQWGRFPDEAHVALIYLLYDLSIVSKKGSRGVGDVYRRSFRDMHLALEVFDFVGAINKSASSGRFGIRDRKRIIDLFEQAHLEMWSKKKGNDWFKITMQQQRMIDSRNIRGFWESRKITGDPVAWAGLSSLNPRGGLMDYLFGGTSINHKIIAFDRVYNEGKVDLTEVRVKLASAHIEAVKSDRDDVHGLLSPRQVAAYHHKVFEQFGLPATAFGGTPFTGNLSEADWTRMFWCSGCE